MPLVDPIRAAVKKSLAVRAVKQYGLNDSIPECYSHELSFIWLEASPVFLSGSCQPCSRGSESSIPSFPESRVSKRLRMSARRERRSKVFTFVRAAVEVRRCVCLVEVVAVGWARWIGTPFLAHHPRAHYLNNLQNLAISAYVAPRQSPLCCKELRPD